MNQLRSPFARRTAAGLAAGMLGVVALAGCGNEDSEPKDPAGASSAPTSAPTSAATASDTPEVPTTDGTSAPPADDLFITPFFVGDTPQGPRLFREVNAAPVDQAVSLLDSGPLDPDYRSLLPVGSLKGGTGFDGVGQDGAFSVELADASWTERPSDLTPAQATLAVQQLVWTLQTVSGGKKYDPDTRTKAPVNFYLDGKEVSYLGVPSGVTARPPLKVLGFVNVLTGFEQPVTGKAVLVSGVSSSFEATIGWQVLDRSGKVAVEGSAMAEGWMGRLFPWSTEVDLSGLPAGNYTFVASTDDPTDGEGPGPTKDTKAFTIE